MSASSLLAAGLTAASLLLIGLALSDLLSTRFGVALDPAERALSAMPGIVLFALGLMVLHIVSRGAVFGSSLAVPAAAVTLLVLRFLRRARVRAVPLRLSRAVYGLALLLAALFVLPLLLGGPGARTGDPPWHFGWTEQLLAGDPVPTGPVPQDLARNAYPWGLHAVMATGVRLIPLADPLLVLDALHLLLVASIPLAAACLARRIDPDAGIWAATAAGAIGGFGWVQARGADLAFSPGNARYGADLVVASPNSIYELFPPALPRELGLVLLVCAGLAMLRVGQRHEDRVHPAVAGVLAGLTGLISVPMFVASLVWIVSLAAMRRERARLLGVAALWSLGVFALWAAPVARDFVRLSGFVDITPRLGREWPLPVALSSWGLLLPLAVTGGWMIVRLKPRPALLAFIAGTGGLLLLSILRGALGWTLAGNATLLHQGRVWPHAHLLAAVCAGVALCWLWTRIRERSRPLAVTLCSLLLAVGAVSPALASVAFTRMMDRGGSGFVYGGEDLAPGSFVRRAAAHLSSDSVVDTSADPLLGFTLWQLSGCRLTGYDDPALPGNDLRIRFRDLATEWQQTGGQAPSTHVLIGGRVPGAVESGTFRGVTFSLVPAR